MTVKDLFRIIIKISGLFLALASFTFLPEIINNLILRANLSALINLIPFFVLLAIIYVLIFKTDSIISLFKLEKGFEKDEIDFGSHTSVKIIQTAIVILSLYFIIDSIPAIITNSFYAFKESIPQNSLDRLLGEIPATHVNYNALTGSSIQLVLSLLLINNHKWMAQKIHSLK